MNEHTPAPWSVEETEWGAKVVDCQEVTVADLPQQPADTWQAADNAALISQSPEMYALLLELAGLDKPEDVAIRLMHGLHAILEVAEPAETGVLWEAVLEEASKVDPQVPFACDEDEDKVRYVFLGSVFALYPSGKYWVMPIATGNVNILEMVRDTMYTEALNAEAERHGGWIESGEGDPCDIFAVFPEELPLARYEVLVRERPAMEECDWVFVCQAMSEAHAREQAMNEPTVGQILSVTRIYDD